MSFRVSLSQRERQLQVLGVHHVAMFEQHWVEGDLGFRVTGRETKATAQELRRRRARDRG